MREASETKLLSSMKPGQVYRRKKLVAFSKSVDRDLSKLLKAGEVKKVSPGMYLKREKSQFGPLPPDDRELVRTFLGDHRFLITSFNNYNSLGLGLTQLRNDTIVYNRKRHVKTKLGSKTFVFKNVREFPRHLSKEFLVVDLLNNLNEVGEPEDQVLSNLKAKIPEYDKVKLAQMSSRYGKVRTQKLLEELSA